MFLSDVGLFLRAYFVSLVWQLVAWPWVERLFSSLIDRGWVVGRLLTTVLISLVIFVLSSLGLAVNTNIFLAILTLFFLVMSLVRIFKNRRGLQEKIKKIFPIILVEELVFLCGVIFMGLMRGFGPDLNSLEKYMDFGFINQYLLSPKLPATDMWLAGKSINYYSFGHFWASEIIRWLTVKPTVGFNLVLAIFFGFDLVLSFAIVVNLIKNVSWWKKVMGGLIAAGLVCLGGNSHILWFMVKNQGLWEGDVPYWYAVATRFIEQTIHEFPAYTFTIGDLHAHLIDLPIVLTFILVLITWNKTTKKEVVGVRLEILMGILLGIMVMTNTWDSLIYGFLLLTFFILRRERVWGLLIIYGVATVTSSPWWWNFAPMTQSINWADERSPIWQLAVLWSGQILFGVVAWWVAEKNILLRSLVITAFVLIAVPEVVYLVDIYNIYPRANTMFKFTYQAFVIFSLLGGVAIGETWIKKRRFVCSLLVAVAAGLLVYPWTSYPNFYDNFKSYKGLDGEKWLVAEMADKYGAIMYLKDHRNGKNLLEYPGESFSLSNATSVFSGVPTVLGWRDHEWLWRNDKNLVDVRRGQIRTVYELAGGVEAKKIIEKYNVGWILISKEERENYAVSRVGMMQMGEIVWAEGENYLVKVF